MIVTLLQIFNSTKQLHTELRNHQSLSFIHDVFEDDFIAPLDILNASENSISFSDKESNTLEYSLSRGRIGRSHNGKRRDFLNHEFFIKSFTCELNNDLLNITLYTLPGNSYDLFYPTK